MSGALNANQLARETFPGLQHGFAVRCDIICVESVIESNSVCMCVCGCVVVVFSLNAACLLLVVQVSVSKSSSL